jgi:site-specific DNA-methyltransferase (adenine-specific)
MSISKALYSSRTDEWSTPQDIFDELHHEFNFTVDAAASKDNAKCKRYFDKETDGLKQSWAGETVWCNPPYGREIGKWMKKALVESRHPRTTVVMLVHARTDTAWFHDYVYHRTEIRFLRGRLKFGGAQYNAPFPSMVVIYRGPET